MYYLLSFRSAEAILMRWSPNHRLLLFYKDDLVQQKSLLSSASASQSLTIELHKQLMKSPGQPLQALMFPNLPPALLYNQRYRTEVPIGCCVWGWWRKSWELHDKLLAALQSAARSSEQPQALLFNQYSRSLYEATIHDIYFEPHLTTVVVPSSWRERIPEYYSDTPHLCGAFFALTIAGEKDAKEIQRLFVDASSFELDESAVSTIIPPPEDSIATCRAMIDGPPRRSRLRVAENTILVLRPNKQKDNTIALLKRHDFADSELAFALRGTAWPDILDVFSNTQVMTWAKLKDCPYAIAEVGRKAREADSRLTRLDFELMSRACASARLRELLAVRNGDGARFGALGTALREWVTTPGERDARRAAAGVFKEAWESARSRYEVIRLAGTYFDHLPAMEAIASAVRHELGKKFYRDHLSHNVRAALLSAALADRLGDASASELNEVVVAFFAGLLHDIAMPVTTYPDTVGNLARALAAVQEGTESKPIVASILDRKPLRRSLAYVALLASTPNLSDSLRRELLAPWKNPEQALEHTDRQLLFEELLCAGSDEHALISAALLFDAAVRGASDKDFDTGVRSLLSRMTGPTASLEGLELASIIQSMALHDRKPVAAYSGVNEPATDTPKPLRWSEFRLPIIVNVADEFQEWGRTVGVIEGLGAVDGSVEMVPGSVSASVVLSDDPRTFASVPFSLLESMMGKIRSIGRIVYDKENHPIKFRVSVKAANLGAFRLSYASTGVATKVMLEDGHEFMSMGDSDVKRTNTIIGDQESELLRVVVDAPSNPGRDYILLNGKRDFLEQCVALARNHARLREITLDSKQAQMTFSCDSVIQGSIESYRFGDISPDNSAPRAQYPKQGGSIALLRMTITGFTAPRSDAVLRRPHMGPAPHFLDSDWRFTERTARSLLNYAQSEADRIGGDVCYLGCPTVALWHAKFSSNKRWMLLDRGHYELTQWLQERAIPKDQFTQFDVFTQLDSRFTEKFAVVIADPPWYEEEYKAFWQQAQALVKPNGIIGITYYPPTLDQLKHEKFKLLMRSENALYGSADVDYEAPEFETISGLQSQFETPESGIYRRGFMDFYQAPPTKKTVQFPAGPKRKDPLPVIVPIDGVHYMRCRQFLDSPETYPISVEGSRYGVDHLKSVPRSCVGWTTRNLIVMIASTGTGTEISSLAELQRFVAEKDRDQTVARFESEKDRDQV